MLTAVMADIHANREAFEACLRHAKAAGAERFVLLGDYVGYGPDPDWATDTVAGMIAAGALAVKGNHDAAVSGDDSDMNALARAAIAWTRARLSAAQAAFLSGLPVSATDAQRLYIHANTWSPEGWDYVTDERRAERCLQYADNRLIFVGHIHVPALYNSHPGVGAQRHQPRFGVPIPLLASRRWVVVVGAVGQPRDGNPAANYCLFDSRSGDITFQRVPYDHAATQAKIIAAGLPEALAKRLGQGA
jgi:diadenosine tetraphosphatase ApaH/serine/threonine PP2A family protein phosphatase